MPLMFDDRGLLVPGTHDATLAEVEQAFARFQRSDRRVTLFVKLKAYLSEVRQTGWQCEVFLDGSFVMPMVDEPNDIDVILVMQDDFRPEICPAESLALFDHGRAGAELGASIFWVRPGMLLGEPLEEFLAHWEQKRDGRRRGIVEIRP